MCISTYTHCKSVHSFYFIIYWLSLWCLCWTVDHNLIHNYLLSALDIFMLMFRLIFVFLILGSHSYFLLCVGLLLQDLMKDVMRSKQKSEFYSLLINTVKFNAAHLDEDIITSFVLWVLLLPYSVSAIFLSYLRLKN